MNGRDERNLGTATRLLRHRGFLVFFTEDAQDRLNPPGFSRNTRQPSVGVHAAWHPLSDTVE